MGKSGSSSFRRMLLSRILLLSIPILLVGEYMVYRKARSGALSSARYNLMETAARKAEDTQATIAMMRSNLLFASQLFVAKAPPARLAQNFVEQVEASLPQQVQCVQLTNTQTGKLAASTCGTEAIAPDALPQLQARQRSTVRPSDVLISPGLTASTLTTAAQAQKQLRLVFSAPIYGADGRLTHVLSAQASLQHQEFGEYLSRQGYTVVINQDGMILAHPLTDRIGQSIDQPPNPPVLKYLLQDAIAGEQDSFHLFEEEWEEWLAGYTVTKIPIVNGEEQTWVILAIAPIANALQDIRGIQQVLVLLTLGLLFASILATLFMTRDLATPLEQLGRYALQIRDRAAATQVPKNFRIRELNQLAAALDSMIQQLDERAAELETAWREAQAANQLKSEFLAVTSHELRTPLNAIIGSVRLIRDGCCDTPEEELEFLQQADDAAIHLLRIINDLLDISKIEFGQLQLTLQPVHVADLCHNCVAMITHRADIKHIRLSVEVIPDLQPVLLDKQRVGQMVINLLSNAVKFTPEAGSVKLKAWQGYGYHLEQENRPDRSPIHPTTSYLCLEVVDSGIGIAPERWHLLFRPFQQIDSSSTRNYEGTGLGLALTKRLAELHGGTVSFASIPGQGSTFRIWLPTAGRPTDTGRPTDG
ncbi:MAG: ATP-binding protein [Leptolyngbyaceae cyanobacterium bins.349]|nr:ATP-binding protein [Leptolyngbyaceae cyanobacterium bins.349]